jgi:hypothetical protein
MVAYNVQSAVDTTNHLIALRLEWRGQHGKNKPDQRDHLTILSFTEIGFSVHTRRIQQQIQIDRV